MGSNEQKVYGSAEIADYVADVESGRIISNHSYYAFARAHMALKHALGHLRLVKTQPDDEVAREFKREVQSPDAENILDLAQQINDELDQLQRRTNLGK